MTMMRSSWSLQKEFLFYFFRFQLVENFKTTLIWIELQIIMSFFSHHQLYHSNLWRINKIKISVGTDSIVPGLRIKRIDRYQSPFFVITIIVLYCFFTILKILKYQLQFLFYSLNIIIFWLNIQKQWETSAS